MDKVSTSGKTINFNFLKVNKLIKINCPELSTVTSNFLHFHSFRKRDRETENERGERERKRERETERERT